MQSRAAAEADFLPKLQPHQGLSQASNRPE
jgi:hypothetical protein